jgi:ketosteroid isomerase-like protein
VTGELEAVVREFLAALDAQDVERMMQSTTFDVQAIDEISRRWLRGRSEVEGYLRGLAESVSEIRTDVKEVEEHLWRDAGLVTCWIDQEYTLDGERQHVSAPTTIVLRWEADEWKVVLLHSVPLPEAA